MAPVVLKRIVSVSSEDRDNPASNLLAASSGGRWLCAPDNKSRTADVVLELCKRTRISSLELCNSGSAFVEVLVSDSENPESYLTLVHMSMLMTLQEARMGRNKSKVVGYGKDKLSSTAAAKKWNRVKIHCVQKYNREDQFGIRSISVFSDTHSSQESVFLSPAQNNTLLPSSPYTANKSIGKNRTTEQSREYRLKLPSSSDPLFNSGKAHDTALTYTTPKKHPLQSRNSNNEESSGLDEFEFSGLEKQSRLFRNCLKGAESESGDNELKPNKILSRISADKSKYEDTIVGLHCPRKKLLKKELPKADIMRDFVDSYRDREKTDNSQMTGACRVMSRHDNDYEIGEEPEKTWGWNRFKGKPKKRGERSSKKMEVSGWINKRRKLTGMIGQCSEIFKKAGQEEAMHVVMEKEAAAEKHTKDLENDCDEDSNSSNDTIIYDEPPETTPSKCSHDDLPLTTPTPAISLVECPLCLCFYPHYAIEVHASECSGDDRDRYASTVGKPVVID